MNLALISKDRKQAIVCQQDTSYIPEMIDLGTWFYGRGSFIANDHGDAITGISDELFDRDINQACDYVIQANPNHNTHAWYQGLIELAKKQGKMIAFVFGPNEQNPYNTCDDYALVHDRETEELWDPNCDGVAIYDPKHDDFLKGKSEYKNYEEWLQIVKANLENYNSYKNGDIYQLDLIDNQTGKSIDSLVGCYIDPNKTLKENVLLIAGDNFDIQTSEDSYWTKAKPVTIYAPTE